MRRELPAAGRPRDEVLAEMRASKTGDADWQHGRVPLYVFKASDELSELGRAAFFEFFSENALGGKRAFPSVKKMEDEVVEMALGLFHAPDGGAGLHVDRRHRKHRPGGADLPRLEPRAARRPGASRQPRHARDRCIRRSTRRRS